MVFLLITATTITTNAKMGAKKKSGNTTIETDTLAVEIKGGLNVPSFFFWHIDEDNTTYKLQLDQIFEAVDNNSNEVYNLGEDKRVANSHLSLASLNWNFSDFEEEKDSSDVTTAIHFNLTTSAGKGNPLHDNLLIQFRMHITSSNDAELKFDVIIDGYTFKDDSAMLVVGFKLITAGNEEPSQNDDTVQFGDGYFSSEPTAQDDDGTIAVGLSTGNEGESKKIFLAYEHFSGKLVHDPTIGVVTNTISDGDGTTDQDLRQIDDSLLPELSKAALITSSILATLAFIMVPSIIYILKKKS